MRTSLFLTPDLALWCLVQVDSSLSCLVKWPNSSKIENGCFDVGRDLLQLWHGSSWWELFCFELDCLVYWEWYAGCGLGTVSLFWALPESGSSNPVGG